MLLTPLVGGKTIALSIWTFVGKVMSLLFSTVCHYFPAKKQSSSDFMAAVTIHSDFEAQEEEIRQCFYLFPSYFHAVMRADTMFLVFFFFFFFGCLVLSHLFHASSPSSRGSLIPLPFLPLEWYHPHYLRLLIFLPPILILACNSSSRVFLMMCSAYRLNKQGDSRQTCCIPFSILNQSVVL